MLGISGTYNFRAPKFKLLGISYDYFADIWSLDLECRVVFFFFVILYS